ncbi:class I SAM-dependent methyltransferase [Insolitispirillum peregrinum]|uniref:class I SAM-dependent methyltransferase n=1 Tax=Insolitispirillum peregrinum TaxID=80876 RepID=UPI00361A1823
MILSASPWIKRFADSVPRDRSILDLACGSGRHGRLFLRMGLPVVLVDRDTDKVQDLTGHPRIEIITADLENNDPWPLPNRSFSAIIVTNYLHRPLFPLLLPCLAPSGILLYETFAAGNEQYGRPRNPDHLLQRGELLRLAQGAGLDIIAYEDILEQRDSELRCIQRICARRPA